MANNKRFASSLTATIVLAAAFSLNAQVTTGPTIKLKPVRIPQVSQPKPTKTRYEVLNMTSAAIQVRSLVNEMEIHTFAYSDQIRDAMQKLVDQGGYQYGDKVEIQYQPGTEVALKIKGRPSKAL